MKNLTLILFVMGLIGTVTVKGQAQLLELKQTVYGMDCAPCAYGLENRINNMDGIKSVSVSLNDGLLTASFADENTLTLRKIRKAVKESGFSPKNAEIKITGTLQEENGNFIIKTSSGEKYALTPVDDDIKRGLNSIKTGKEVTLSGRIQREKSETAIWDLAVDDL